MEYSNQNNELQSCSPAEMSGYDQEDSGPGYSVDESGQQMDMAVDAGGWPILPGKEMGFPAVELAATDAGGWAVDKPGTGATDELEAGVAEMEVDDASAGLPAPADTELAGAAEKTGVATDQVPESSFSGIRSCNQEEPIISKPSPGKKRKKYPGHGTKMAK